MNAVPMSNPSLPDLSDETLVDDLTDDEFDLILEAAGPEEEEDDDIDDDADEDDDDEDYEDEE